RVLVTSRRHLTTLEDARAVSLDTLPPSDAAGLLVRLAARAGLDPGDPAVAEITRLCGYLPLAIGMLARQLHHHPAWTPADAGGGSGLAGGRTGQRARRRRLRRRPWPAGPGLRPVRGDERVLPPPGALGPGAR